MIADALRPSEMTRALQAIGPLLLVLACLWALAHCFLGRVLFGGLLIGDALLAGGLLGSALLTAARAEPAALDYLVAGGAGIALLGTLAWCAPRLAFAVLIALGVGVFFLAVAGWVLAVLLGLLAALLAWAHLRALVAPLFALNGAVVATLSAAALVAGRTPLSRYLFGERHQVWLVVLLLGLTAGLAVLGAVAQMRLQQVVRSAVTPEHVLRWARRRCRGRSRRR